MTTYIKTWIKDTYLTLTNDEAEKLMGAIDADEMFPEDILRLPDEWESLAEMSESFDSSEHTALSVSSLYIATRNLRKGVTGSAKRRKSSGLGRDAQSQVTELCKFFGVTEILILFGGKRIVETVK